MFRTRPLATDSILILITVVGLSGVVGAQSCPPLDPVDDGTGLSTGLWISEISPGNFIELHNATLSDIDLSLSAYQLCSRPSYMAVGPLSGGTPVLPALGYVTLPWPPTFTDTDAGGEIALYDGMNFNDATLMVDFVCWGVNPHLSRKTEAESAGKWSGDCAPALSAGSIQRLPATDGTTDASYDTISAPDPTDCAPVSPFVRGDCNDDGLFNIADAVNLLSVLFPPPGGGPTPACGDACDGNDDGALDIADAIAILGVLFPPAMGPPPTIPAPHPDCGPDPTADGLGCPIFANCP